MAMNYRKAMKIVANPDDYSFEEKKEAYAIHNDNVRAYTCRYEPAEGGRDWETFECDSALEAYKLFLDSNMLKNLPVKVTMDHEKMIEFDESYGLEDPSFVSNDPSWPFHVEFDDHIKKPAD